MKNITFFVLLMMLSNNLPSQEAPLKVAVIGLTHTHVHWIFGSNEKPEFEIVGIVEPNRDLAERYAKQYNYPLDKVFDSSEELIKAVQPEAVTAFGNIYDHLSVVEFFAPKGIHVMVEKPLAVSTEHAEKMQTLAQKHNIQLLTNYETTWYPSKHKAYQLVNKDSVIGDIRKVVVRDGHRGPKKIGINQEFLDWLTDPKLNGGGAITDFGCYGANLLTWLAKGEKPISVTALTHQLQAENNPLVDDEAIILLKYETYVAVIQASWNWPIGRKDMEIHGLKGSIFADNRHDVRVRIAEGYDGFTEEKMTLSERAKPLDDPFVYFASVIKGETQAAPYDLSSLENNMIVVEILEAASKSAKSGQTVMLER